MNIYDHCRLSVRKFGGVVDDYYGIHKFMDSSKLFYFNPRHRLLLHNLYGIEMTIKRFGDYIVNSENIVILVRDIAAEHCKEDLSGRVPSLSDWLKDNEEEIAPMITLPKFENKILEEFVLFPKFKSNCHSALLITLSNFGVYLANEILGFEYGKELQTLLNQKATVQNYLSKYKFTKRWQFTPAPKESEWLKMNSSQTETSLKLEK
jgi:hypothetical protein